MGLGLEADTDVLNGARKHRVGDTGESTGGVVLAIGQIALLGGAGKVAGFEPAAGLVEGAELDRDTGTDTEERGQSALVESERTLGLPNGLGGGEGVGVGSRGLETDLDNIKRLAWRENVSNVVI